MGFKDFFTNRFKKTVSSPDPISQLSLADMKKGYFVDYDMKTWEVVSENRYDFGSEDIVYEWQLAAHDETVFLEREVDDEDYWTLNTKLPFLKLDAETRTALTKSETPPETMQFQGKTYFLEETGGALFYKDSSTQGKEVFKWDYCTEDQSQWLTVEQWGEHEYELSKGIKVEEYQFSNILPNV
ncbi:MAG: DUF4178 domain-containing protein [Thermodesulfobacteriota bacterium]|nr:DUF4178 domain-containing protein [Thermodesulfobacteriota bacterium]